MGLLRGKQSTRRRKAVLDARKRALLCAQAALAKKAEDVVILDVRKISSFTDYFVICHGTSDRQARAIALSVEDKIKKSGGGGILGTEGHSDAGWILVDCGDVVAHIFKEPTRHFYDLERLWIHAEEVKIPGEK